MKTLFILDFWLGFFGGAAAVWCLPRIKAWLVRALDKLKSKL